MNNVVVNIDEALKKFRTADHILYVTYPLVSDNKLLISVAENLNLALLKALDALLMYECLFKRIRDVPFDFIDKLDILKRITGPKYKIERSSIVVIEELYGIIEERRKSPIEFVKKEKYVICSDDYRISVLTVEKLKNYLNTSRLFITKVNNLVKNARRFSTL